MSRRYASPANVIRISDILRDAMVRKEDGQIEYKDNWTDGRVAIEADATGNVNANHVRRVRLDLYGPLIRPVSDRPEASLRRRVESLEERMTFLELGLGVTR